MKEDGEVIAATSTPRFLILIDCPDCGRQETHKGRCPKCGGDSWIPAGGRHTLRWKMMRLRRKA